MIIIIASPKAKPREDIDIFGGKNPSGFWIQTKSIMLIHIF